jgi:hypothetical protein
MCELAGRGLFGTYLRTYRASRRSRKVGRMFDINHVDPALARLLATYLAVRKHMQMDRRSRGKLRIESISPRRNCANTIGDQIDRDHRLEI